MNWKDDLKKDLDLDLVSKVGKDDLIQVLKTTGWWSKLYHNFIEMNNQKDYSFIVGGAFSDPNSNKSYVYDYVLTLKPEPNKVKSNTYLKEDRARVEFHILSKKGLKKLEIVLQALVSSDDWLVVLWDDINEKVALLMYTNIRRAI